MKILFVIPSLDYGGTAKQISLLAPALPRERFEVRVCALGRDGPLGETLRQAGFHVEALGWQRGLDLGAWRRLRARLHAFRPDVVHAWRPQVLRLLGLAGWGWLDRSIISAPFVPKERRSANGPLDRWLLRRVKRVVVATSAEVERCRQVGVAEHRLVRVSPAVAEPDPFTTAAVVLPHGIRPIVCVGPLAVHKGFRDAIWALDILHYVENAVQLFLIGDGSERSNLEHFIQVTGTASRVHLLGPQPDVASVLAQAEVVWVPSRAAGGVNVALEAMALGKPVVAARLPDLAEIVVAGQTGFLVAPGDKVGLARQTRALLADAALRRRMGEAGRQRVHDHFGVAALAQRMATLYEDRSS